MSILSTVTIAPRATHLYSIIWLHGLGADGHDFEGIVPELHLDAVEHIHFIFPEAPVQAVTVSGGAAMRAWYDILEADVEKVVDEIGIYQSANSIYQIIQDEIDKGIPAQHILLAGFSQGGVIALHAGLRFPQALAGIIALSTYLPTTAQLAIERAKANNAIPIFMGHGILDSIVAIESGKKAVDELQALGYKVKWHDYLMEHRVCIEEIEHISDFINAIFPAR